jgi:hypothetical protein
MFAPVQHLRNWREQRPSSKADLGSIVTGEIGKVDYIGVDLILFLFLYCNT